MVFVVVEDAFDEESKTALIAVADPALNLHVGAAEQTPTQRTNLEPGDGAALRSTRDW